MTRPSANGPSTLPVRGIDEAREAGGTMITLWLGQDGVDHPFEADYRRLWEHEVEGIRAVAEHAPDFPVSIEYKPNEPRALSVIPNVAATLMAIEEAGAPNLGVTLDFAHVLYGDTSPAMAAALVGRRSRMLGLHLNDGYGKRDDGLMVGSVHTVQTIELLRQLRRDGFAGTIYFDTFPDGAGLDPVAECSANVATIESSSTSSTACRRRSSRRRSQCTMRSRPSDWCRRRSSARTRDRPADSAGLRRGQSALRYDGAGALPAPHRRDAHG